MDIIRQYPGSRIIRTCSHRINLPHPMLDAYLALLRELVVSAEPMAYRLAGYFMSTLMDDPAMLAFAFC